MRSTTKLRTKILSAGLAGGVAFALLATTAPAVASPASSESKKDSSQQVYVLDESTSGAQKVGNSAFYPLPESSKDALVVIGDVASDLGVKKTGALSSAESVQFKDKLSAAAASQPIAEALKVAPEPEYDDGSTSWYAPPGGAWGPWHQRRISQMSADGKYYSWQVDFSSSPSVCGQGMGYWRGYNGSQFGLWEKVYPLGCGKGGYKRVPWDNVLAYPKFQAQAYGANPLGSVGLFS